MQKTLLALTLCLTAFGANANTDSKRQLATKLMNVDGSKQALHVGNQLIVHQTRISMPFTIPDAFFKKLEENLNNPKLQQDIAELYAKHLSAAELQAAITFYQSPEGKALSSKMGVLAEGLAGLSARYTDFAMSATLQEFADHPAIQQLQQGQP